MAKTLQKSLVGQTFRSTYADGNPLWRVVKKAGPQAWQCVIDEYYEIDGKTVPCDFFGTVKLFSTKEINGSKNFENLWEQLATHCDNFYNTLNTGDIVHYNNGFNEYVRCNVLPDKRLMPVALVGNWKQWDLPQRRQDGSIYNGYHADCILKQQPFQPNATNIYEYQLANKTTRADSLDPRPLPAVDLSVPDMTPEQNETAQNWQHVQQLQDILANRDGNDTRHTNPADILNEVRGYLLNIPFTKKEIEHSKPIR